MTKVEQTMNNSHQIPINGTARYLRIESFSLSKPFKTETQGVHAIIGMLEVSLRVLRPQPTYEKIENVYFDVNQEFTQSQCNKNLKE
ncbi:hypothetical protein [Bacillus sp. JJ722]|uniref:hypothetical protein n=1 Tax=Bacillus sp. JJ722 TaxID=3122973 RepID=UPI002FFD5873